MLAKATLVTASAHMTLRPYQEEALRISKHKFDHGITRQLIALPTGTGKTVIFACLPRHHQIAGRILILVHRAELAEQAKRKIEKWNPGVKVGIEMGDQSSWSGQKVVVAGVQTIGRVGCPQVNRRLLKLRPDEFDAVVCDEAHHSVADTYIRVFEHFQLIQPGNKKLLLGVTATPVRADGQGLWSVYQEIVYSMSITEAVKNGWLSDLKGYRVHTSVRLDTVPTSGDDFIVAALAQSVNTELRNELIVKSWFEHAQGRQTVVFCATIQHAKEVANAFRRANVSADAIWGEDVERSRKLYDHQQKKLRVLANCAVLTEGYDDWRVACIVMARPTLSQLLFVQMVGRGTRIPEGIDNLNTARLAGCTIEKQDCVIIDVADNTRKHRLITLPSLFGLPLGTDLQGRSPCGQRGSMIDPTKWQSSLLEKVRKLATETEEVDLLQMQSSDSVVARSVVEWDKTHDGSLLITLPERGRFIITRVADCAWSVDVQVAGQRYKFGEFTSLEESLASSERALKEHRFCNLLRDLERESRSRSYGPTPVQKALLKQFGYARVPPSFTRDQASKHLLSAGLHAYCAKYRKFLPRESRGQF
jgi:superfamily II DNA or RNA helicase